MAESVPPADNAGGLNDGQTVAAPNSAAPEAADPAQSYVDDGYVPTEPVAERESWRETWRKAGLLLLGGLALAGAIVLAFWVLSPSTKTAGPTPTAAPTPTNDTARVTTAPATTSVAAASPQPIASTPDQDNNYVQALNKRGISFANPDAAIHNGKVVCQDIAQGMTVQQIIASFSASNPALGKDADAYMSISVHAYCPQNVSLVGPEPGG